LKVKQKPREPWQGIARREDEGKEITAPCGCVFIAEYFEHGGLFLVLKKGQTIGDALRLRRKGRTSFYWFRRKDCPKVKALDKCIP